MTDQNKPPAGNNVYTKEVSLHDENGVQYTDAHPVPTSVISSVLSTVLAAILAAIVAVGATAILILGYLDGTVSADNSTSTPLAADTGGVDHIFTGTSVEILGSGIIFVNIATDVASATDGLMIEQSSDGVNWDHDDVYTVPAGAAKNYSINPYAQYLRVTYTNGIVAQGYFRLQTIYKPNSLASSHRIQDSIQDEDDATLNKSVLSGESSLDGNFDNVTTYRGALDVNSAWLHRKIVNETFHFETATQTTLSTAAAIYDTSIIVTDATGIIVGDQVKIQEGAIQEIGTLTITIVAGTTLTLDRPIANNYTTSADIIKVETNMAVNGSLAAPVIFEIDPPITNIWQITRILISMTDQTSMDDAKFGGLVALTNGVSLRATTSAGRTVVFANWKSNQDLKLDMFNVDYSTKAPAGFFGLNGRWTFTASEVVAELDGDADPIQKMEILIQDDLTGLDTFIIRAQGRVFRP